MDHLVAGERKPHRALFRRVDDDVRRGELDGWDSLGHLDLVSELEAHFAVTIDADRALVAARWRDAVVRGVPVLVTQAGAMSRPILQRLGFREVCEIQIFLDGAASPGADR